MYPLLETVRTPDDLRRLDEAQLARLAAELRAFLIESVGRTGGHLAAGLGTVELTIALHYVFDTPHDRLVWDTGHQSYPHKILTGRREQMKNLRRKNGLAGFPRRDESPYDAFGAGHAGTAVSAALGMALAQSLESGHGDERKVIAVLGDGALTAGLSFEALNHAGDLNANLLVILNDNDMSISPNVGGMSNYLARVLSGKIYSTVRERGKRILAAVPPVQDWARRAEEHMKGMVTPGTLFEEIGFNYIGPIDGHDLPTLLTTLRNMRALKGPQFLHIVTQKGKGYQPAENDPCAYHGVAAFDIESGEPLSKAGAKPSYTQVFGDWLCDMAARDSRLVAITPAMREGSGLVKFSEAYPERYLDVGIAEQHAVTLAAGLACEGRKPVVAIYSSFLQRAYDQVIHDVALQNLPVLFAIDRAGLVGPDGPTHAGAFDLSFLRCVPNLVIMTPGDENESRAMLSTGFLHSGPAAVRYPRGGGPGAAVKPGLATLPIGKAELRRKGKKIALLAFGALLQPALAAADELNATVINMRFVKPLDVNLVLQIAATHELLVTLEDNSVMGGAGSAVAECLTQARVRTALINLGLPDRFVEHGAREELLADCGLDTEGVLRAVRAHFETQRAAQATQ
ncbi:MAG: 1-deoxy-D-xylulose-5-phosphate synthase [Gammaproteobacteria bacterium]|nr:MAG: 1-deoxy-D-xylulose-5-phosphate synthase [Gammaproteobacteria bacterium]